MSFGGFIGHLHFEIKHVLTARCCGQAGVRAARDRRTRIVGKQVDWRVLTKKDAPAVWARCLIADTLYLMHHVRWTLRLLVAVRSGAWVLLC